jgi:hypothetical protein
MSNEVEQVNPGEAFVLHHLRQRLDVRTAAEVRRTTYSGTSGALGPTLWAALDPRFRVLLIDGDPGLEHVVVHEHSIAD